MKIQTSRIGLKALLTQGAGGVMIVVLAYYILVTGIHGLRYFTDFPAQVTTSKWLLLPHIGAGFIALVLGPWQFWKGFRQRYRYLHRWMGRIYLDAVAISAFLGLYMAITDDNLIFSTGITGLALGWIVTGTLAYLTIRRKLVQEHREWMIRNYVLTLGFVSYRVGSQFMLGEGVPFEDTVIMAWLCWVPQLFVTEVLLRLSHSGLFRKKGRMSAQI